MVILKILKLEIKMIIGLTGTKSSGKGAVAEILKNKGFAILSLSDQVREEAIKRGLLNYQAKDLQNIGNDLREKYSVGVLAQRTLQFIEQNKNNINNSNKNYVIDGIRNIGEIKVFRKRPDFYLISLDAPIKERFQRFVKRNRKGDSEIWKEFLEIDKKDKGIGEKNTGQQVRKCIEFADQIIYNNSSFKQLQLDVEKILEKISKK